MNLLAATIDYSLRDPYNNPMRQVARLVFERTGGERAALRLVRERLMLRLTAEAPERSPIAVEARAVFVARALAIYDGAINSCSYKATRDDMADSPARRARRGPREEYEVEDLENV